MMTSDTWLTYAEAAASLSMTTESVRQRARREGWRRTIGNDGRARVMLPPDTTRIPAGATDDDAPASRSVKRPEPDPSATALLQARIADLEARAAELRGDLDHERAERLAERERAERLVGEVADLARQLARVTEEAGDRERELRDRTATAETALAEVKAQPWWRRLVS